MAVVLVTAISAGLLAERGEGAEARPVTHPASEVRGVTDAIRPATTPAVVPPHGWVSTVAHIRSGGLERTYTVVRPAADTTGPLPVLMVLAGRGMAPAGIARAAGLPAGAVRAALVYPAGYERSWDAGACCGPAHAARIDDRAFLAAVVRRVLATVPGTSASQVYLAGFSNGGRMAYWMACTYPAMFTAVAAVEAVPVAPCPGSAPVSIAVVAATNDPLLSISAPQPRRIVAGMVEPRVSDVVAMWRRIDGCSAQAVVTRTATATFTTWRRCADATRVQYDLYAGGAHRWPPRTASAPSATTVIWKFFRNG